MKQRVRKARRRVHVWLPRVIFGLWVLLLLQAVIDNSASPAPAGPTRLTQEDAP